MLTNQLTPSTFFNVKDFFNNLTNTTNVFPSAAIYETENGFTLEVELPGVKKENVSIQMEKNVLSVKGSRKRGETETTYERSFRVADQIDTEKVSAVMEDGILSISLSKKKEAEAKKIEIQ